MSIANDVSAPLAAALRTAGLDTVDGAFACKGGIDLNKPNLGTRRRTQLTLTDSDGRVYELYVKRYGRRGWRDGLDRLTKHGWGLSPATIEFNNIRAARAAGVPTMETVAQGQQGWCCRGRSYLVVTAVGGDALERCADAFLARRGEDGAAEMAAKLAELVGTFHRAGYVHRDLYAAHVFLDETDGQVSLQLIDLARMFRPRCRRRRWVVKDLAQLKYSMPAAWVEQWWGTFMTDYAANDSGSLNADIDSKVTRMRNRQERKGGA